MKCPKCQSENVTVQAVKKKKSILTGFLLLGGGLGLLLLGVIGLALGLIIGLIIGLIVKALLPETYESIAICQDCGHNFPAPSIPDDNCRLFCSEKEASFIVNRKTSATGSAVDLKIIIDGMDSFRLSDGTTAYLKIPAGHHTVGYQQTSGLGKANRTGSLSIDLQAGAQKHLYVTMEKKGLSVNLD